MKIKDLKDIIQDLPDDMDIFLGLERSEHEGYGIVGREPRKMKIRLAKMIDGSQFVQSRPHKDPEAKLSLIIE